MYTCILVIKLRSFGDTVILTACLEELMLAYPEAKIDVLVQSEWGVLLEKIKGIRQIWSYAPKVFFLKRIFSFSRLVFSLKKQKYDCVINLHASPSSAFLSFLTGAKVRAIHFHDFFSKNTYSTVEIPEKGMLKPIIERDMDTLRGLGLNILTGRLPVIELQADDIRLAQVFLTRMQIFSPSSPLLGLGLGASRATKRWSLDRFVELAFFWIEKTKGSVFALAGPEEGEIVASFLKQSQDKGGHKGFFFEKIKATHQIELKNLAAILSQFSVFATNDSGPKHLAVAVGTPTVTLFGPEHPFEWHPYSQQQHPYFFRDSLACRKSGDPKMPPWCGLSECFIEKHRCMNLISVSAVFEACQKVARRRGEEKK